MNIASPLLRSNDKYTARAIKEMSMLRQDFAGINKRPEPLSRLGARQERDRLQGEPRFPNKGKGTHGYPQSNTVQNNQPPSSQHVGKASHTLTMPNTKPQIPGFKTTQLNLQSSSGASTALLNPPDDGSSTSVDQSDTIALTTVMDELKRIQDKMDNTSALVTRLDKMSVLHNRQTEMINKTQDALSSLSADVQSLHQVNGGSFAGKLEAIDARVTEFEKSISDMSREVIASSAESKRLQESYHEQQNGSMMEEFATANKRITDAIQVIDKLRAEIVTLEQKCTVLESRLQTEATTSKTTLSTQDGFDKLSKQVQEAQDMAIQAFHQSILASVTLDQECNVWCGKFSNSYKAPSGTTFTVRFPMIHYDDGIYMKHVGVKPNGTVYEEHVPIEVAGSKVASFVGNVPVRDAISCDT